MFPKLVREGGLNELKPRLRCISISNYPFQEEGHWHFPCMFASAGHSVLYLQSWEGHQLGEFFMCMRSRLSNGREIGGFTLHM